jgi:hypothetical protein
MKHNRWVVALGLVLCGLLAGCSSDDGATDIEGTWTMTEASYAGIKMTPPMINGSLNLNDGKYTMTFSAFGESESDSGSYKVSGSSITFTSSDGSSVTGSLSDGNKKITINAEGATMIFAKN